MNIVSLLPAIPKIAGLSCDEIHVLLCSAVALANDPVGFADCACENLLEPAEMLTAHLSYHGFSVNHQAFHTACYQMRADVARWTGIEHKQGVGILWGPQTCHGLATSSPSGERDHCSVAEGGGLGDEMASGCLLLMMWFWPTVGVEKSLELTKESKNNHKTQKYVHYFVLINKMDTV